MKNNKTLRSHGKIKNNKRQGPLTPPSIYTNNKEYILLEKENIADMPSDSFWGKADLLKSELKALEINRLNSQMRTIKPGYKPKSIYNITNIPPPSPVSSQRSSNL